MKNPTLSELPQLLLLNFLAKFVTEKKTSNEHFNLCKAEISLNEIIESINSDARGVTSRIRMWYVIYKNVIMQTIDPFYF